MDNSTVLVLADPAERQLAMLEELAEGASVAVGNRTEAFANAARDADVILNWSGGLALFREVWQMTPRVRWVHSRAAGLDGVLFPELIASPVPLTNGSGVFSQSLGEFVLGAVLYFAKDFARMRRNQSAGRWAPFDVEEISTQTMGIVGYGDIGRACAGRAKAMGMRVLALRRRPERSVGDDCVDRVYGLDGLLEMIAECDYVVAAAPLTPDTYHLVGKAALAAMKPSAVVINAGRGPVIDETALIEALEQKRIRGAGLDVFEKEPLPDGHAFYRLDNVLLSPHCADHTSDWLEQAMRFFLDQFARYRAGLALKNVVDKQLGY
jgi:phosphoglycerate dehydrogenase-like enzyme